ncbi:adenylate/guanylate cyclase domain-containing protein [Iodobacter sp. CM08]|uniref:CHASE2 domain-containing protein n=1 Tax=Iodobacter sp. CM08 TaxID=3085902 RepID=UPI0029823F1C|nr:adenylate/guanylate cyclase domain-containing protein [Iodobacter sp. CM08]MDW5417664.1 adenylate/guanylate cyclase domain-containing protein [Iodobacter sp. CM08]
MHKFSIQSANVFLPIAALMLALAILWADFTPLQTLRNQLFDQYQHGSARHSTGLAVQIIDIDDESLARLGQWPWPRTRLAAIINKLQEAKVAAIGFDVVFAEADHSSPQAMAELWSLQEPLKSALTALPNHDTIFAQSIKTAPVVLGLTVRRETGPEPQSTPQYRYVYAGPEPSRWLHSFQSAIVALPAFEHAASGNGALNFIPDQDGVVRRIPLLLRLGNKLVPSLDAEVLRVAQGGQNYIIKTLANGQPDTLRIGSFTIPLTEHGEAWIHYAKPDPARYLSAWKLLAGQIPAPTLKGKMILIGSSAQGLMDLRFSPLGQIIPGVEVHAQMLEQISSGSVLQRPGWARSTESIISLLGALAIGLLTMRFRALFAASITLIGLLILQLLGWYTFRQHALLLDTVTPALIFITTFTLGSLIHHWQSERKQRWIKQAFSRYVSPNRVSHLIANPDSMALGGRRQECSFIFTDLANFTALMEKLDPADAVALLNDYLDQMIAIAFKYEGTLDRIVGDALAIMFSAPVTQADHRSRALNCALEMDLFASDYSAALNARGTPFGITRIGIHSGEVIVGNFGGRTLFDYRALGDAVNTASRLESVNKHLGTTICLSQATLSGCSHAEVRPIGRLILKGKSQPLQVFEPVTSQRVANYAPLEQYCKLYQAMVDGAATANDFNQLAQQYPQDPLLTLHLDRLSKGEQSDLIVMTQK